MPEFRDVSPRTRRMGFCVRSGRSFSVVVRRKAARQSGCVAEGQLKAGRSRRPRMTCVCGTGSTRIHQTEMEQPTIGAAATERWSGRGPGMRHGVGPLTASEFESLIKLRRARRVSGDCFTAHPDGSQGGLSLGSDFGCDYWSALSPFVSSGLSPFVRKLLPWMTIASP